MAGLAAFWKWEPGFIRILRVAKSTCGQVMRHSSKRSVVSTANSRSGVRSGRSVCLSFTASRGVMTRGGRFFSFIWPLRNLPNVIGGSLVDQLLQVGIPDIVDIFVPADDTNKPVDRPVDKLGII